MLFSPSQLKWNSERHPNRRLDARPIRRGATGFTSRPRFPPVHQRRAPGAWHSRLLVIVWSTQPRKGRFFPLLTLLSHTHHHSSSTRIISIALAWFSYSCRCIIVSCTPFPPPPRTLLSIERSTLCFYSISVVAGMRDQCRQMCGSWVVGPGVCRCQVRSVCVWGERKQGNRPRVISELHCQRGLQLLELRVFVVFLRPPTTRCCCCVSVGGVSRKKGGRTVFDGAGSCWYVDRDVFGAHEALVELFLLEVVEFL